MQKQLHEHPAIAEGHVAVISGGASGIGLAAARRFGGAGMRWSFSICPGLRSMRRAPGSPPTASL
jgi:hypothetical protein